MSKATVGSKGQITNPVDLRRALNIDVGDRLHFAQMEAGEYLVVAINRSVTELKGMFSKPATPVSIEDMNQAIATRGASAG